MKKIIIIGFLFLSLAGCVKKDDASEDVISLYSHEVALDVSDYKAILFIPLEGCGSCIQNSVEFFKENSDNTDILYVFCTHKPFAYQFLKEYNGYNVHVDRQCVAIKHHILSTAPSLFVREGDSFVSRGIPDKALMISELYKDI